MSTTEKTIEVDGKAYLLKIITRPFREGQEVRVVMDDQEISLGELGLGQAALLERVTAEIRKIRK